LVETALNPVEEVGEARIVIGLAPHFGIPCDVDAAGLIV
jgi:hypothetical protein